MDQLNTNCVYVCVYLAALLLKLKPCSRNLLNVAVSENPVLKADAIKYLMVFRNQVCTVVVLIS